MKSRSILNALENNKSNSVTIEPTPYESDINRHRNQTKILTDSTISSEDIKAKARFQLNSALKEGNVRKIDRLLANMKCSDFGIAESIETNPYSILIHKQKIPIEERKRLVVKLKEMAVSPEIAKQVTINEFTKESCSDNFILHLLNEEQDLSEKLFIINVFKNQYEFTLYPLILANSNQVEIFELFKKAGISLSQNKLFELAETAVLNHDKSKLNLLITIGLDVNADKILKQTPLMGRLIGEKEFWKRYVYSGNTVTKEDIYMDKDPLPITEECRKRSEYPRKRMELLKILLDNGADPNVLHPELNLTLIFFALQDPIALHMLLQYGANPNVKGDQNDAPLLFGCVYYPFQPVSLQLLLDFGADPNARNNLGDNIFDWMDAWKYAHASELKKILTRAKTRCIHPPMLSYEPNPLNEAVSKNDIESAEIILNNGTIDVDKKIQAFMMAIDKNRFDMVKHIFYKVKIDLNSAEVNNLTPLILAIKRGNAPIINFLLVEAGADPNSADAQGKTPLMYAIENSPYIDTQRPQTINKLFSFGANFEKQDNHGNTALFYVNCQRYQLLDLQRIGINPKIKNKEGLTAADFCKKQGVFSESFLQSFKEIEDAYSKDLADWRYTAHLSKVIKLLLLNLLAMPDWKKNLKEVVFYNLFTFIKYDSRIIKSFEKQILYIKNEEISFFEKIRFDDRNSITNHRINEALSNLVTNCKKYSHEGASTYISYRHTLFRADILENEMGEQITGMTPKNT